MKNRTAGMLDTVKRLIRYMFRFYPVMLPVIIVFILANAVISSLPSIFQQNVVAVMEEAWGTGASWETVQPAVMHFVYILAGLYAVSLILGFAYNQLMALFTQGFLDKIRREMFEHMESLPIRYFDTHKHGDIMSHYTNDVDAMRQMISQAFPQLLISAITIVSILCIMCYYSIPMAVVILLGAAVTVTITKKIGGKSAKYFMAQQKAVARTEGVVEEMINGQKVVKVFNHEMQTQQEFDRVNEELFEAAYEANRYSNTLMPILNNVNYIVYVMVAVMGGVFLELNFPNLSVSGLPFSIAVIVPFLGMSRQFAGSIQQISPQINSTVMGIAGAARVFALLDEQPEADEGYVELVNATEKNGVLEEAHEKTGLWAWKHPHQADGTITYTPLKGNIQFYDVDFSYNPDKVILHNITLYGKPGQKIAFVGATGAGKTTITNLINRFYDIADGKIRYDGININKIKKSSLRKSLGIILQDTVLFTGTVMDNIRYGKPEASDEEVVRAAMAANAHEFIMSLPQGYDTDIGQRGVKLSGGQKQRLSIARVFLKNPPVLIFDEATSALDNESEKIVQYSLEKLAKDRTTFVIAHRLSTIRNAQRILVLTENGIAEEGTHESLLKKGGIYAGLYEMQF